ncbi:hypothetical protein BCR33DRAFT_711620 [Rhizoclosmatium globosum]|uniref:Uncharacterized protein n=1 Tax=Rhizoclosmatium globosum TaxID=329046 RepID=A0A1Y2CZ33_9FUNG|nr:hypothetical protein BCR33DRAFT_711620 [Rhizoclosmatium globosum]|eukprot:ORY52279.1 hypothetical protein BCR33DRAFT_711620 [Rhizoclosmatium globosum]
MVEPPSVPDNTSLPWRWKSRSRHFNRVHIQWHAFSKVPTQIVNNALTDYKEAPHSISSLVATKPETKFLPKYKFRIVSASDHTAEYGELVLRIGNDPWVFWNGTSDTNILAIQFARAVHNLKTIYITCDPTNIASFKTLERIGFEGQCMGTFDVPEQAPLYRTGMRKVISYRYGPACCVKTWSYTYKPVERWMWI